MNRHDRDSMCNDNPFITRPTHALEFFTTYGTKDQGSDLQLYFIFLTYLVMHRSFATTSPSGPGNSGDIDFFSFQSARVYTRHCGDTLKFKALQKAPLKSRQVNANFHVQFVHVIKTPAVPRHCGDSAEVKTSQFSTAMPPLSPARGGRGCK